jgi:hypothetical protein
MLWHTAFLLMTVLTVLIGYYDVAVAAAFWVVMTLILIPLRPQ